MKIYLAAPLFNEMELERNLRICNRLEDIGLSVFMPQRDGGAVYKIMQDNPGMNEVEVEDKIFNMDISAMVNSDVILFLMDGIALDEGSCFELGYMYAIGKKCYGYKTDARNFGNGKENLMIQNSLIKIFRKEEELIRFFFEEIK